MARINKVVKKSFADILKQRKLEQIKAAKEKEATIQALKELQFDEFVRKTAKEMLKGRFKYDLKVFNAINYD